MAINNGIALLCLLPLGACAAPDDDAIASDRPDFVDSSAVVGKHRFQIETGVATERDKADGMRDREDSTPLLLRYGVSDDWELRLETDGRLRATSDDLAAGSRSRVIGYADVSVGAKWHVRDAAGAWPALGLVGSWDLDTGSRPLRAQGKGGTLRLGAEWDLPGDLNLGLVQGLAWQHRDDGQRLPVRCLASPWKNRGMNASARSLNTRRGRSPAPATAVRSVRSISAPAGCSANRSGSIRRCRAASTATRRTGTGRPACRCGSSYAKLSWGDAVRPAGRRTGPPAAGCCASSLNTPTSCDSCWA